MEATDILELDPEILRCAILDDAGRIVSYAESDKGKIAKLPANFSVTIKALAIQSLSQAIPKEFGIVKFTTVTTDKYRMVTMMIQGQTVMLALPLQAAPDQICDAAFKKFANVPFPTGPIPRF